ncbi:MAG: hypothetical protein J6A69_11645 [Clostridia bacterium]|nr:hypothetical protein [Clostridia bacterium]
MKSYFSEEITKTVNTLKEDKYDLCFALLSDSKLSDEGAVTRENIAEIDKEANFDFSVHCGNFILGNNPEKISRRLMREEMQSYKDSTKSRKLFVCQGYNDGWRDERFKGQLACNIVCDESWSEDTVFLNEYVVRNGNAPYYYADMEDKKTRIICLCSYVSDLDRENEMYEKYISLGVKQTVWLDKEALNLPMGWNVIIFSHRIPHSRFENGEDPFIYQGFSIEKTLAVLQQAKDRGINIVAWIAGGYGADGYAVVGGINYVTIPSQSISSAINKCNLTEVKREKNTLSQECWNICALNTESRELRLIRFGAGEDRIIKY